MNEILQGFAHRDTVSDGLLDAFSCVKQIRNQ